MRVYLESASDFVSFHGCDGSGSCVQSSTAFRVHHSMRRYFGVGKLISHHPCIVEPKLRVSHETARARRESGTQFYPFLTAWAAPDWRRLDSLKCSRRARKSFLSSP